MADTWTIGKIWVDGEDVPINIEVTQTNPNDALHYTVIPLTNLLAVDGNGDIEEDVIGVVFDLNFNTKSDGPRNMGETIIINNFDGLTNLQSLIFRNGALTLGEQAFLNAGSASGNALTLFLASEGLPSMESNAFSGAKIDEIRSAYYQIISYDTSFNPTFNVGTSGTDYSSPGVEEVPIKLAEGVGARTGGKVLLLQSSTEPTACFVAGTIIKTDQGNIAIEKVKTSNTIRGVPVCRVTKRLSKNNLVLVKKDAFGVNRPNKNTISTHWHGVYLKDSDKEFVRLINLVDNKKVIEQYYKFEYVYNIELKDKHSYMHANNLKVETLIPGHD